MVLAGLGISAAALAIAPMLMPDGYNWMSGTISESAAQGVDGAWVARLGFVLFGLSVLALVPLKTRAWGTIAAGFHAAFGAFMVAVAAFSHANPFGGPSDATEDLLHSIAASGMGFAFALGIVARQVHQRRARVFDVVAVVAAMKQGQAYIESNPVESRRILQEYTKLPEAVASTVPLPTYNFDIRAGDLDIWVKVLKDIGEFNGQVDTRKLVLPAGK